MPESKDVYQLGFSKVAGCLLDFSPSQVQKFFQKQPHLWMFKYLLKSDLTEYVTNYVNSHLIFFCTEKPVQLKLKTLYHSCGFYFHIPSFDPRANSNLQNQDFITASRSI